MLCLNKDVLFLIFKELRNDNKSLYSCLLVNRTWCEIVIPILWKNPGQYFITNNSKNILFNVILLHLSEESRDILRNHGINKLITETYQRPLFNYINFWKYLDLFLIESMIPLKNIKHSGISIVRNEIFNLFIDRNIKLIHFSIPGSLECFDYQLHNILRIERCLSELESFYCGFDIDQNILEGLARICKSIKKLVFGNSGNSNYGIIKLIEVQKNLNDVDFKCMNEPLKKSLEESLIKHADTIQYLRINWEPITRFLSYLVNLLSLEINELCNINCNELNHLENLSLPILKILKARQVPYKVLANLIENTKGYLSEISVYYDIYYSYVDYKRLIQAIYQNCPKLRFLELSLFVTNANPFTSELEFENLLINCQFLNGLVISISGSGIFSWDKLFEILTKSSPISLFKFKFYSYNTIKLEYLKLFFDNWKDRNPILLKIGSNYYSMSVQEKQQLEDLTEKYKTKGIIKKYFIGFGSFVHEDFEWI